MNFENIQNGLNSANTEPATIDVKVVTLSGVDSYTIGAGMSVSEFKARYGLTGTKIANENGDILSDSATINSAQELFVSTPKKNG